MFPALRSSFSICCKAGLVVLYSLSFCLSIKVLISPLNLNEKKKKIVVIIIIFSCDLSCQCPCPHSEPQPIPACPGSPPVLLGRSLDLLWALWGQLRL